MPMRKVIARGYYQRKVWEPGEQIDVPDGFQASWLEAVQPKKAPPRIKKPADDNAG